MSLLLLGRLDLCTKGGGSRAGEAGVLAAQCSVASVPLQLGCLSHLCCLHFSHQALPQPGEGARGVGTDVAAAFFLLPYGLVGWGQSLGPHLPSPLHWLGPWAQLPWQGP